MADLRAINRSFRVVCTVFSGLCSLLALSTHSVQAYSFDYVYIFQPATGITPSSGVIAGSDGALYGVTTYGGAHGSGTFFRVTPDGTLRVLYNLTGDRIQERGPLVEGPDHALYGVDSLKAGLVYRRSSEGSLSLLNAIGSVHTTAYPQKVAVDTDGTIFGIGVIDNGVEDIWKISPDGTETILHQFAGPEGWDPRGGLILAHDGNLYGATAWGGSPTDGFNGTEGNGVIYRMTKSGVYTVVHRFAADDDGNFPTGGLTQGTDGAIYGTTYASTPGYGTIFKLNSSGFSTVYRFDGYDGQGGPLSDLLIDAAGNIYGTTSGDYGIVGVGSVFRLSPQGEMTVLKEFVRTDIGVYPGGALAFGADGRLYGATPRTGVLNTGTIFAITVEPVAPTGLTGVRTRGQVKLTWSSVPGADTYDVYRSASSGDGGTTPFRAGLTSTSFTDTGISDDSIYYYWVTAVNKGGESVRSAQYISYPLAGAELVSTDTTTQGNWKGNYGVDGFGIADDPSANNPTLPSYASFYVYEGDSYTWSYNTSLAPALEVTAAGSTKRMAAAWFWPTSFKIDLAMKDGKSHQYSLYFLDWMNSHRSEMVTITNASSGEVLDRQLITDFSGGIYKTWQISGHVTITISTVTGRNCVVSGMFLGGQWPPFSPTSVAANGGVARVDLSWAPSHGATSYNVYRTTSEASIAGKPYRTGITETSFADTGLPVGRTYYYRVTAVSAVGESDKSELVSGTPISSVQFVKSDLRTRGNWKGIYGSDGYNIISDTSAANPSYPTYVQVATHGASTINWSQTSTLGSSLQKVDPTDTTRVAGAWSSLLGFSIDINVTDGKSHQIALYLLDWKNTGRIETLTAVDTATGKVLDTRTISSFNAGAYEVYKISGHVKISVDKLAGTNCVVSGLFLN